MARDRVNLVNRQAHRVGHLGVLDARVTREAKKTRHRDWIFAEWRANDLLTQAFVGQPLDTDVIAGAVERTAVVRAFLTISIDATLAPLERQRTTGEEQRERGEAH